MKKQYRMTHLFKLSGLLALALLALALTASVQAAAPIVPDGLSATEWDSIQAQIAAAEYQFAAADNGWTATNRAQGWQTNFGPAGAQVSPADGRWSWGLTPVSYGYEGDLRGLVRLSAADLVGLTADKETVTYQWDKNLSEWWVNSAAGLEQGFTVQTRPGRAQGQPLLINMAVSGDLTPVMDGGDVLFQNAAGETILRYDRLYVVDANGQTIPARLILHPSSFILQIVVDDANAVYPLTIDPWLEQQKLTASDGAADDHFGTSVAVDGDTVVIGAQYDDDNGSNSGSAYVFTRSGGVWTEQAKLLASDGAAVDRFGYAVAVSGDTAVIGVPLDDDNGSNSGSAYVFIRSGAVWTEQVKLTASDGAANDVFGSSVVVDSDTAVIGARMDDIGGNLDQGSAYVFTRSGTVWTEQQKLTASDGAQNDNFSRNAVAVSGDTVIIGAHQAAVGGNTNQGAAYVFTRSGNVWTEQAKLTASDGAVDDTFGWGVAMSGNTVVIGAHYDDDDGSYSGSAYVFTGSGATWSEQQKLTASDGAANDYFGESVTISGDTVVIGAYQDDDNGSASGSAYVFTRSGGTWSEQQKLLASDGAAGDSLGYSVSVSGDTAVVSAHWATVGGNSGQGAAYVFTPCIGSAQTGTWATGSTWEGGVAPTIADGACVNNGHTVTMDADAAVDTLRVFSGGTLDWATFNFTAENGAWNYGTMQQTQTVDGSGPVNFLQIRDSGDTVDQYLGLDFAAGVNLGVTTVQVMGNTAVCNNNDGGSYRDRCFMANPTNAGTVNITLHTTPGEDDLTDDAFFQYASGSTWTPGAACNDGAGVGGACTGSATFASPAWFLVGSGGSNPTAVTLQTISASTNNTPFILLAMMMIVGVATAAFITRRKQA